MNPVIICVFMFLMLMAHSFNSVICQLKVRFFVTLLEDFRVLRRYYPFSGPPGIQSLLNLQTLKRFSWRVFTPRNRTQITLYGNLVFSLKYEGINLLFSRNYLSALKNRSLNVLFKTNHSVNTVAKYDFCTSG